MILEMQLTKAICFRLLKIALDRTKRFQTNTLIQQLGLGWCIRTTHNIGKYQSSAWSQYTPCFRQNRIMLSGSDVQESIHRDTQIDAFILHRRMHIRLGGKLDRCLANAFVAVISAHLVRQSLRGLHHLARDIDTKAGPQHTLMRHASQESAISAAHIQTAYFCALIKIINKIHQVIFMQYLRHANPFLQRQFRQLWVRGH
mmetsp:Transcript_27299/g.44844  ORF Transcript_27299/g.44844 Transcript_27299/m.44844 type:complete len:201 (+) Transcript_27299:1297-1899(+)